MKIRLLILFVLFWVNVNAQKLPITGLCLDDVLAVTGGTCLDEAFTNANPTYFDPAYAVAGGDWLDDFRNYGQQECTRPTGLWDIIFMYLVNGVTITSAEACDPSVLAACTTCYGYNGQTTFITEGSDVYLGYPGTDCTLMYDGYYVVWGVWCTDCPPSWMGVQIINGKWYYVYC